MERKLVSQAGGSTFLDKCRNGFNAIMNEVDKLEQIVGDDDGKLESAGYFAQESAMLDDVNVIHVSVWVW